MTAGNSHDVDRLRGRAHRLLLAGATVEVVDALLGVGIDALVIKGAAFASLLYETTEERYFGDVDLLVEPERFEDAVALVRQLGFEAMWPGAAASETSPHALELSRGAAILDLHRHLPLLDASPEIVWAALWERRQALPLAPGTVQGLDLESAAIVAALHLVWSVQPTQAATDLTRAIDRCADLGQVSALARAVGAMPVLAAALRRIGRDDLVQGLGLGDAHSTAVTLAAQGAPPLAMGLERFASTRSWRSRGRLFFREVLPSPAGMRYWRPWTSRSRWHLVLGYAWRPVYLVRHAPTAILAWYRAHRESER